MGALFRVIAFCGVFVLAACATVGNPADRPLDPLLDDIATVVLAFDLPRGLGPAPDSVFTFDVANGGPTEHLQLTPQPADVDALPAGLPPPATDRAYYFFVFSPADMQKIRDAQITAQLNNASSRAVTLRFIPRLCSAGTADPRMTVSILAVLPGHNAKYFIKNTRLGDLLQQTGSTQIPACV